MSATTSPGVSEPYTEAQPGSQGELIGYGALIRGAFSLCLTSASTFSAAAVGYVLSYLVIAAMFVGLVGLAFVTASVESSTAVELIAGCIIIILAIVLANLANTALLQALLRRQERRGFWRSYGSLLPHILPLVLLAFMLQLAVSGGFLLLIIPGIALSTYLLFAVVVFADTGRGGIWALHASYQLVRGRWWSVLGRLLSAIIVFFLTAFGVVLAIILLWGFVNLIVASTGGGVSMAGGLLMLLVLIPIYLGLIFGALFFMTSTIVLLYESLKATAPATLAPAAPPSTFTQVLIALMVLGSLLFGFQLYSATNDVTSLLNIFNSEYDVSPPTASVRDERQDGLVQLQLSNARSQAEIYYSNNTFSYAGVCEVLEPMVSAAGNVACNDSDDAYALTANIGREIWCTDSMGEFSPYEFSLGQSTSCGANDTNVIESDGGSYEDYWESLLDESGNVAPLPPMDESGYMPPSQGAPSPSLE